MKTPKQLFIQGYISALRWSSTVIDYENSEEPIEADSYWLKESKEFKKKCEYDCADFIKDNAELLAEYVTYIVPNEYNAWERAGHDFALTRNGHGSGYWDRKYKDELWNKDVNYIGERLTEACHKWSEVNLFIDNNTLYIG